MWIAGTVNMVSLLALGLGPGAAEPNVDAGSFGGSVSYVHAQQVQEPQIWLDRGVDPVLEAGDRVRIYYRTNVDAYVAILQIDTDGTTRMSYPRSPTENHYARAGREYRLLFPWSAYWNVDDRPGVGYFFIVTSPTPFDFSDFRYSYYYSGWDLSAVGSTVYSDPYVAMDDYVARLVPDWEYVDYGLDFIRYDVGGAHEFPRFLCYQCHGFRPYGTWNPYRYACVNFTVVIYDDPYFYPSNRYGANRVVMAGPRNPARPRFEFKERAAGDPGTQVTVVRQGGREDPAPAGDRRRTGQRAGAGRVASPPVVPDPTETRRPDVSGRPEAPGGRADAPRVRGDDDTPRLRAGGGRVTTPPTGDRDVRRPTLQRRSTAPSPDARPPTERVRPNSTEPRRAPQADRPSARRPDNPRAAPSSRQPATPPSTRRRAEPSGGSASTRPAPRARTRTPQSDRGATRSSARRAPATRGR